MTKTLLLISLLFFLGSSYAQEAFQTVRGTVLEKENRQPVKGATIALFGNNDTFQTLSDSAGEFLFSHIAIGRYSMVISKAGYQPFTRPDIVLFSAKQAVINAELEEEVISIKAIEISQKRTNPANTNNDMVMVSGRQFTTDQTSRYAGSLLDPSRMAGNFAGVMGTSGQRNDIIVRGNSPMGLLWRLEGIDIPNPNHFSSQGATGGPVSMLNNNNLANSDFMTSAFPAEYGNALSGVFDLRMRDGNNRKREYTGQIGFNGFELGAEGPFAKNKKASYMVNYRYSTLGFFDAIGINLTFAGVPYYQDICFKISLPGKGKSDWSITGVGGKSHIDLLNSKKDSTTLSFGSSVRDNIRNGSGMGALIVSNTYKLKKGYIKTMVAATHESRFTKYDTLDVNDNPTTTYGEGSSIFKYTLHSFLNRKLGHRHVLRTGIIATHTVASIKDSAMNDDGIVHMLRDIQKNADLLQAYAEVKSSLGKKFSMNSGLHWQYLLTNHTQAIEPRLGLRYRLSKNQSLSAGLGFHSQMQPLEIYYGQTFNPITNQYWLTNLNLKFSRAKHFVIGYDNQLGSNLRFKAEAYYQRLTKIPVEQGNSSYSVLNLGADFGGLFVVDSLLNKGTGTNYGLEITLEKFFAKNYYFLVTGSFFDSKFTTYDGRTFNTAFNGKFVVNTLGGYEWNLGKNNRKVLGLNLKVTNAGGRRYTPVDKVESMKTERVQYDWSRAYSMQFKNYFRTDFKISFKLNGKKVSQEWALDIQNIFNTQNPLNLSFDRKTGTTHFEYQQGRLPIMFYRIQF